MENGSKHMTEEKRIALVTGASQGIGAAIALQLAKDGFHVVLTARNEEKLIETEDRIHEAGGSATIAPLDLANGEDVDKLAYAVSKRFGKLDLLVLNAAILGTLSPLGHQVPKEFDAVMTLNAIAPFRLIRGFDAALRLGRGTVVAVTSSVGSRPRAYWGAYGASKAALENMVATYADEMQSLGVNAIILDPGRTRTAMRARAYPGEDPALLKSPEDVAKVLSAGLTKEPGLHRLSA